LIPSTTPDDEMRGPPLSPEFVAAPVWI